MGAGDRFPLSTKWRLTWRHGVLVMVMLAPLLVLAGVAPIRQDPAYHDFADTRAVLGIPNGLDVLSSLAFSLVGVLGVIHFLRGRLEACRGAWLAVFVSLVLVGLGSAYYHWHPDDATLVWDRLPMALGFMGVLVALLSEHLHARLGTLLLPALVLGLASVSYWYWREDLWLYVWVQLMPVLIIPLVVVLFPSGYSHQWLLLVCFGCYLMAKAAELYDGAVFGATGGWISGHTLKHLLAAMGGYAILLMLKLRRPSPGMVSTA